MPWPVWKARHGCSVQRQAQPPLQPAQRPGRPRGRLTAPKVCKAVGHLLPDNAILIDEAITSA
jgi:acetolactate synthase-1/2/3 large subunit